MRDEVRHVIGIEQSKTNPDILVIKTESYDVLLNNRAWLFIDKIKRG